MSPDVARSKQELRARLKAVRRALDPVWVGTSSEQIVRRLVALDAFRAARVVGCYLSLPHEVQTGRLIELCWKGGKKVCVPAYHAGADRYDMAWLEPGEATVPGPAGVLQPAVPRRFAAREVDLMIVPAIAFDRTGRRIGHGGGHYDRLLGGYAGFRVGLAFEAQMVDEVPVEQGDVSVDRVVTEAAIYPEDPSVRAGSGKE